MIAAREIGSVDDYLNRICEGIQLSQTQFETAVKRYRRVGEWLIQEETAMDRLSPEVFPQGSMLQGTTVRPTRVDKEVVPFDIDTVCRCAVDPYSKSSQSVYGSVLSRLQDHAEFAQRIRNAADECPTSGKCIKLSYSSDDFYLDVVPTCKDPTDPDGIRLMMCLPGRWHDAKNPIDTWRRTDPFRFAGWLHQRCAVGRTLLEKRAVASVAPVPPQEAVEEKAPLRRAVQLLKARRDREFVGHACRPSSILVTTLAGLHYSGQDTVFAALVTVLDGIISQIQKAGSKRIIIINPTDELAPHAGGFEDLAAVMDDAAYIRFCAMIVSMRRWLDRLTKTHGPDELRPALEEAFGGRIAVAALKSAQEAVRDANTRRLILASGPAASALHIAAESSRAAAPTVRSSDFHGPG